MMISFVVLLCLYSSALTCQPGNITQYNDTATPYSSISPEECKNIIGDSDKDMILFHSYYLSEDYYDFPGRKQPYYADYYRNALDRIQTCRNLDVHARILKFRLDVCEGAPGNSIYPRYIRKNCSEIFHLSKDIDEMMQQIMKENNITTLKYDSVEDIDRYSISQGSYAVFVGSPQSRVYDVLTNLTSQRPSLMYLSSESTAVKDAFGVQDNGLVVISGHGHYRNTLEGESSPEDYIWFVDKYRLSGVYFMKYWSDVITSYFTEDKDHVILLAKSDDEKTRTAEAAMKQMDEEFKGEFMFIVHKIDEDDRIYGKAYFKDIQNFPTIRIVEAEGSIFNSRKLDGTITEEALRLTLIQFKKDKSKL